MWDWFQHLQITDVKQDSAEAMARARDNQFDLRVVEGKLAALSLVTQGMWELMKERGFSQRELEQRIEEIDLRDGKKDGKLTTNISKCPDCGRRLSKRHSNCFWCGATLPSSGIFPNAD